MLAAGDVISITPADKRRPPVEVLEDMLRGPRNWQPCPVFLGPVETAFRVLADTQAVNVAVDFDSLHTSQDFKKLTASIFGQDIADTTICPTVPRLRNLVHCGQQCQAVLATTTRISRIPIPPGRVLPLQHIIFLDLRPILQEVTWVLAQEGQVNLPQLCEQFLVDAPEGYCVSFKDGLVRPLDTQEIVTVPHGGVLVVEFVLEYIEDSSEHFDDSDAPDNQDTEAQESSSSSSESASSNGQQCREPGMHQQFFYPRIIPVWLQPSEKWATFLALPAWDPVQEDEEFQLHSGICITILPRGWFVTWAIEGWVNVYRLSCTVLACIRDGFILRPADYRGCFCLLGQSFNQLEVDLPVVKVIPVTSSMRLWTF
ncbi:hypothetical protein AK812_SmicGene11427 [Symbiodinium microadriaticum]|uniref:Uncharacterized protein n=1 Tax=Symbiodinium microadriaticum TaxID=2951 RepID=A0A1Q9ED88_SYMMI|nr:hypothetical protein AK812_SmicGene11427 [Symbiodinium microadriaticum]